MINMAGAPPAAQPLNAAIAAPPPQPVDPAALFFAQETLKQPTWDDVIGLFHNDRLRSFTVDIETDSTIVADEISEKQAVTEFVQMLSQLLSQAIPLVQQTPELAPLIMETIKYATRRFKAGRQMETIIDETTDSILQKLSNMPPAPQDPKVVAAQMLAQAKIQQGQDQIQIERMKTAAQVDLKHQEAAADFGLRQAQAQADASLEMSKAQADAQVAAIRARNPTIKVG